MIVWDGATLSVENIQAWYWTGDTDINSVAVGNVDGDAGVEIVTGGYYTDGVRRSQLIVWDGATLSVENIAAWNWISDTQINSIAVGNIDTDAEMEIITGGMYDDGSQLNALIICWVITEV